MKKEEIYTIKGKLWSASQFVSNQKYPILFLFGLILVVFIRIYLQIALFRSGFISLTADEFSRIVLADQWSGTHVIPLYGLWPPLYLVLYGIGLEVSRNLLWTPRFMAAGIGILSIFATYYLSKALFNNSWVALLSSLFLAISPAAIWLSSTALTEMPYSLLVLVFMFFFIVYLKTSKPGYLIVSALILALATALRFEAWIITALYCLFLTLSMVVQAFQKKNRPPNLLLYGVVILIPCLFPAVWFVGNYLHSGDFLYFLNAIKDYKLLWYGHNYSYYNYITTFFKLDPGLTLLIGFAFWVCLRRNLRSMPILIFSGLTILPILIFILLHAGQIEPPGNYVRYLAPFIFPLYPTFAYFIYFVTKGLIKNPVLARIGLSLTLVSIVFIQVRATFQYHNDASSDGVAVGEMLYKLRSESPGLANRFAIIELDYWQYLAIHVGSNDTRHILYDRPLDLAKRASMSFINTNWDAFNACLTEYDVSFIIIRELSLQKIIEGKLKILPERFVNGYAFYNVSALPHRSGEGNSIPCPLLPGSGF